MSPYAAINVLIVDDHASARWVVREFLNGTSSRIRTVGEAESGEQALVLTKTLCPDVVVLDLVLPDIHGIEVTAKLKALSLSPAVLIRTGHACERNILQSKAAGAEGFITKENLDWLEEAIIRVAGGQSAIFESSPLVRGTDRQGDRSAA